MNDGFRSLTLVGLLTWVLVGVPTLIWEIQQHTILTNRGITWMVCFVAFLMVFYFGPHHPLGAKLTVLVAQTLLALACCYLQPLGFQPVLLVIVAVQLGGLPLLGALGWILFQSFALLAIVYNVSGGVLHTSAYVAFQMFAVFTARIAHNEMAARQRLAETNAELQVATDLLQMSSRTEERLRIARELHDLLGHHLAALSINLEVASHLAEGAALEQIQKSRDITRLLLGDVREVVSALRHDEPIDLAAALRSLGNVIETPKLHIDAASDLYISEAATAQVALRVVQEIVTNAVRHSGAGNLWLTVRQTPTTLSIDAHDDGRGCAQVSFGNGLKGMRERIEELHGELQIEANRGAGFRLHVAIPTSGVET